MSVEAENEIRDLMDHLNGAISEMNLWRERALKAEYEATHDPMTGVLNRKGLFEAYEATFDHGSYDFIYMIDIDGLKTVNDTLGHSAGDDFIKTVVQQLEKLALSANGVVARVGGDEFVLLVKEIIYFGNPENFSHGWVCVTNHSDIDAAIAKADSRMYTRKTARKRLAEKE